MLLHIISRCFTLSHVAVLSQIVGKTQQEINDLLVAHISFFRFERKAMLNDLGLKHYRALANELLKRLLSPNLGVTTTKMLTHSTDSVVTSTLAALAKKINWQPPEDLVGFRGTCDALVDAHDVAVHFDVTLRFEAARAAVVFPVLYGEQIRKGQHTLLCAVLTNYKLLMRNHKTKK